MSFFWANKYTIESQFEAVKGISAEKAGERDRDFAQGRFVFFTEWERENFLKRLTKEDIQEASKWICEQRSKYPGVLEDLFKSYEATVGKYAQEKYQLTLQCQAWLTDLKTDLPQAKPTPQWVAPENRKPEAPVAPAKPATPAVETPRKADPISVPAPVPTPPSATSSAPKPAPIPPKKGSAVYERPRRDKVGSVDVTEQGQRFEIEVTPDQLSNRYKQAIEALDPKLKSEVESLAKASSAHMLVWGLIAADAVPFGNEQSYDAGMSGYFKYWNRYIDGSPAYFGKAVESRSKALSAAYMSASAELGAAILSGDSAKISSNVAKMRRTVITDLGTEISDLIDPATVKSEKVKATYAKYKARIDSGDTLAAYEFVTEVSNNPAYLEGAVFSSLSFKTDVTALNNALATENDKAKIESFFANNRQITIMGKPFSIPPAPYGDIVVKARMESAKLNNGIVEPQYVFQVVAVEIFKQNKKELLASNDPELKKWMESFYSHQGAWADLSRHWSSYAIKGTMMAAAMIGTGGAVGAGLSALPIVAGTKTAFAATFVANTLAYTTVGTVGSGIISGKTLAESAQPLKDSDTWIKSAVMTGVFMGVTKGLEVLTATKAATGAARSVESLAGGKYLLRAADFGTHVGVMVGVNHAVFDGEFTAEEIVNAVIFVAALKMSSAMIKKENGKIKITPPERSELNGLIKERSAIFKERAVISREAKMAAETGAPLDVTRGYDVRIVSLDTKLMGLDTKIQAAQGRLQAYGALMEKPPVEAVRIGVIPKTGNAQSQLSLATPAQRAEAAEYQAVKAAESAKGKKQPEKAKPAEAKLVAEAEVNATKTAKAAERLVTPAEQAKAKAGAEADLAASKKTLGETFNKETLSALAKKMKVVPGFLYKHTIGDFIKQIKLWAAKAKGPEGSIPSAAVDITRTAFISGRSDHWTPGWGKVLGVGVLTGLTAMEKSTDGMPDFSNVTAGDYLRNYYQMVMLGWLANAVIESKGLYNTGGLAVDWGTTVVETP